MKLSLFRKLCAADQLAAVASEHRAAGRVIVLCHGCFDIVHPGHLRYLQFARQQGDVLVVTLTGDDAIEKADGTRPFVPQELRAEALAALEFVDHVAIAEGPTAEPIIRVLRPDVYIKGKEYEDSTHAGFLSEKTLVEELGGRVIYSSGEVVFSSSEIIEGMGETLSESGLPGLSRLGPCCARWGVDAAWARAMVREGFAGKRVAVVGDAIDDHYVFCDPSGVAGEAPILSVRPLREAHYLGGGAIIAAHLRALGARPHLITARGDDEASRLLLSELDRLGVEHTSFPTRHALPAKQRYLVDTQKLLKVDRCESQPLDSATERRCLATLAELRTTLDAVIFADFGLGTVTSPLLAQAMPMLRPAVGVIAGGVSGVRRTLLQFADADLLAPNERELRGVAGDLDGSLPTIAMGVMKRLGLANLAVTMGQRGCVLFRPRERDRSEWFRSRLRSDYLPALASNPVDPLGAGDAFLATATLALCGGSSLPQAGYLGSAAAAVALARIGNQPVSAVDLLAWLKPRPELAPAARASAG